MSPAIVLVALLATFATMIWYGNTLLTRAYHKTMFAGFLASVTQWLLFLAIGYNPVNAIFCTAVIFIAMVTAWFSSSGNSPRRNVRRKTGNQVMRSGCISSAA